MDLTELGQVQWKKKPGTERVGGPQQPIFHSEWAQDDDDDECLFVIETCYLFLFAQVCYHVHVAYPSQNIALLISMKMNGG